MNRGPYQGAGCERRKAMHNEDRDRLLDDLYARVAVLRMFVIADASARWPAERVENWHEIMTERLEASASPSELGRAKWILALDDLADLLRRAARGAPDRPE